MGKAVQMPYVETIKTANGPRYRGGFRANGRKYSRVFEYRYEAETWATLEEARARNGIATLAAPTPPPVQAIVPPPPAGRAPTIHAHATDFVERRSGRLSAATLSNYRHHVRALLAEGLGARPMDSVPRSDVERWQTAGVKAGTGRVTLNQRLKFLRSVYIDAMAEFPGVVVHNPTHGVDNLPTADLPDRVLTEAEAAALVLAAGTDPATRLPILLALYAGCRWSEAFGVSAASVLSDRFLSIHQVIERDTRQVRQYTKSTRRRTVPITDARLSRELVAYAAARAAQDGPSALLFPSADGGPMVYWTWVRTKYTPAVQAAGILPATFHELRHTYGSRLAAKGVVRSEIKTLMGHADEETTARYIHAGTDGHRYDLVAAALAPAAKRKGRRRSA